MLSTTGLWGCQPPTTLRSLAAWACMSSFHHLPAGVPPLALLWKASPLSLHFYFGYGTAHRNWQCSMSICNCMLVYRRPRLALARSFLSLPSATFPPQQKARIELLQNFAGLVYACPQKPGRDILHGIRQSWLPGTGSGTLMWTF